jgi:hypothetical protein
MRSAVVSGVAAGLTAGTTVVALLIGLRFLGVVNERHWWNQMQRAIARGTARVPDYR